LSLQPERDYNFSLQSDHICQKLRHAHFADQLERIQLCAARYRKAPPKCATLRIVEPSNFRELGNLRMRAEHPFHAAAEDLGAVVTHDVDEAMFLSDRVC
jgi:hypothetical protein